MTDTVSFDMQRHTGNIAAQIEQKRQGKRKLVRHGGTLCSCCYAAPPAKGQKYCRECHNRAARDSGRRKAAELKSLRALQQVEKVA